MIQAGKKREKFELAARRGAVTVHYDPRVRGTVPRAQIPRAVYLFPSLSVVTDDYVRHAADGQIAQVPWAAVIAITRESEAALYLHDKDDAGRELLHGPHLSLVKGVA